MKDCIFCRIAKGEIPCFKIYEDKDFLAFLDIAPFTEGHTLVIPKQHYRWVWDVPNIGEYFKIVQKIAKNFQKNLGDDYVSSFIAGNDVPHAHIHILPKPYNLQVNWPRDKLTPEKAKELVQKLSLK